MKRAWDIFVRLLLPWIALALIGWGVWLYDYRAAPLAIGGLLWLDLFFLGRLPRQPPKGEA